MLGDLCNFCKQASLSDTVTQTSRVELLGRFDDSEGGKLISWCGFCGAKTTNVSPKNGLCFRDLPYQLQIALEVFEKRVSLLRDPYFEPEIYDPQAGELMCLLDEEHDLKGDFLRVGCGCRETRFYLDGRVEDREAILDTSTPPSSQVRTKICDRREDPWSELHQRLDELMWGRSQIELFQDAIASLSFGEHEFWCGDPKEYLFSGAYLLSDEPLFEYPERLKLNLFFQHPDEDGEDNKSDN